MIKRLASGAALVLTMSAALHGAAATQDPRGAYLAGKRAEGSDRRRAHFSAGIAAARTRLAANPDDPEGLLWLAANLGAEALERGRIGALRVLPEMERLLLRLEATAPLHDHAAAARTLGTLYHRAPAFISIGSNEKARHYFEKALSRAGDYPPNQILAAEFFAARGERDRARSLAHAYLKSPVPESEFPDAAEWARSARKLASW